MSQEELAHLAEVDRSYLGRVERGDNNVAIMTLCRIAQALHVSGAQLWPWHSYKVSGGLSCMRDKRRPALLIRKPGIEPGMILMILRTELEMDRLSG
jgi:transcriptional regulator with XRE-family HTH domain